MNKLFTGAIATAAGVALLMGGAGTFAYWNSSAAPTSSTITAGNLLVADSGSAAVWKSGSTVIDPASYKIVPGDTLTYTKTMAITATGDNLVATLGLANGSIAGATSAAADTKLASYLTKSAVLTATGTGIAAVSGQTNQFTVTAGTAGVSQNVTITVTIAFPKDASATTNNDAKLGAVTLSGLNVTLSQN